MADRKCARCGLVKDEKKFQRSFGNAYKNTCKACEAKRERARLKLAMFDALGQRCNCCGETHPDFLTLDHVKNDGAELRLSRVIRNAKQLGLKPSAIERGNRRWNEQQIYRLAIREGWPKDKYQVLCMSCNFAKGHFGECPHKSGKIPEQRIEELRELAKVHKKFRNFQN